MKRFDIAVCGAGPAGSTVACYLSRAGYDVILFEQAEFPRHQIGESLLPFSWKIFEEIGFAQKVRDAGFVQKFGATFHSERSKAGHSFLFEKSVNPLFPSICHVPRDKFDAMLLDHARECGVTVMQPHAVRKVDKHPDQVVINDEFSVKLLIRANGITNQQAHPDCYIQNDQEDNATGIYSYFPWKRRTGTNRDGDVLIDLFYENDEQTTPSWAWAIPINEEVMSVGYVLRTHVFAGYRKEGKSLNDIGQELLARVPFIQESISSTLPMEDYRMRFNFQRVSRQIVHEREIFIGDAAGFIDPVFSSGVHIGLNSARMAAKIIQAAQLPSGDFSQAALLPFQMTYRRLFWNYYRFVKLFYEKNLVENLFLLTDPERDDYTRQLTREFTSILSGDVDSPNSIIRSLDTARLTINPEVREVFGSAAALPVKLETEVNNI